jgi:hypothetical protein
MIPILLYLTSSLCDERKPKEFDQAKPQLLIATNSHFDNMMPQVPNLLLSFRNQLSPTLNIYDFFLLALDLIANKWFITV